VEGYCHHRPPKWHLPVTESILLPPDVEGRNHERVLQTTRLTCKNMTMLITRSLSGYDIRTFECPACDDVHRRVVVLVDPMKSRTTAGWLRSELRAPN